GLINYYYYKDQSIGFMPLIMNLVSEGYIPKVYLSKNAWLYNSYRMFIFPFYIYYYYLLMISIKKKQLVLYLLTLFIIVSLMDAVINRNDFISTNLAITRIVGGLFILISSSIYLMEILKSNELLVFHKTLPFWITFGALIYYLTTIPIFIFKQYLNEFDSYSIYTTILYISNYFLYGFFIIGFILNAIEYNKKKSEIRVKT